MKMNNFCEKILNFITERQLFSKGDKLLAGVSGGADSVAMMYAMHHLGFDLTVGHINHNLRPGHCEKDQAFVIEQADKLGLKVLTGSVDVRQHSQLNKISIETAARELRIKTLADMAQSCGCSAIITAHHKDDNAETMVHRLMRGTGFRGLCGIRDINFIADTKFVRPMLCVSRDEIIEYLNGNGIGWRVDHTNDELEYTRNKIRHQLIPYLEKDCTKKLNDKLFTISTKCCKLQRKVDKISDDVFDSVCSHRGGEVFIDIFLFNAQAKIVRAELIRRAIACLNVGERDFTASHYSDILNIAEARNGTANLPGQISAYVKNDTLIMSLRKTDDVPVKLNLSGVTQFGGCVFETEFLQADDCELKNFIDHKNSCIEWFDFDKIAGDLVARYRRDGDKFMPMGKKTFRKAGDFTTGKFDPLIADDQKVVWIAGSRPCQQTKVQPDTKRILQIRFLPNL